VKVLRYLLGLVVAAALFLVMYACVFGINTYMNWNIPSMVEWARYTLQCVGATCILVIIYGAAVGDR